jgi:signal-transduction protein with cAMP-binding, CBS, and nucleotidyltransferase domain
MYVKEIKLSSSIKYIKSSDKLTTVRNELLKNKVSCQVVVDEVNNICGIITDRDLLKVEQADFEKIQAGDICSEILLTVTEKDTIKHASILMVNNHCHHLLVITDDEEQVSGVISSIDIVNYYTQIHHG